MSCSLFLDWSSWLPSSSFLLMEVCTLLLYLMGELLFQFHLFWNFQEVLTVTTRSEVFLLIVSEKARNLPWAWHANQEDSNTWLTWRFWRTTLLMSATEKYLARQGTSVKAAFRIGHNIFIVVWEWSFKTLPQKALAKQLFQLHLHLMTCNRGCDYYNSRYSREKCEICFMAPINFSVTLQFICYLHAVIFIPHILPPLH